MNDIHRPAKPPQALLPHTIKVLLFFAIWQWLAVVVNRLDSSRLVVMNITGHDIVAIHEAGEFHKPLNSIIQVMEVASLRAILEWSRTPVLPV